MALGCEGRGSERDKEQLVGSKVSLEMSWVNIEVTIAHLLMDSLLQFDVLS